MPPRAGMSIRIGLAGWSNPPGVKDDRPPDRSHLEHYAERFSCVEINSSFYRVHRPTTYEAWRLATPGSFRFAVKMPRSVTHESGLRGTRQEVTKFFTSLEPLRHKLGAVLIQLPPSLAFHMRNAGAFFRSLPDLGRGILVCEPRHESWFTDPANALMDRLGIARVAADPARVDGAGLPGGDLTKAYFRWHGSPQIYYSSYSPAKLADFATQVAHAGASNAWCIFDNTARHAAWNNALSLRAQLSAQRTSPGKLKVI